MIKSMTPTIEPNTIPPIALSERPGSLLETGFEGGLYCEFEGGRTGGVVVAVVWEAVRVGEFSILGSG